MKVVFFTLLFLSSISYAQTFSENRASDMVAVLQSDALKSLLQQEDGIGNITSVAFYSSMSADAATRYKVTFYSGIASGKSACSAVVARIDGVDGLIKITKSTCD